MNVHLLKIFFFAALSSNTDSSDITYHLICDPILQNESKGLFELGMPQYSVLNYLHNELSFIIIITIDQVLVEIESF